MDPILEDQKYSNCADRKTTSKELVELFNQFKYLKENAMILSDENNMKKHLNHSISLWNQLLTMANQANEKNKNEFDLYRADVAKIFTNINETNIFSKEQVFSKDTFFAYLNLLNTPEIQQYFIAQSPSTIPDSIRESNVYIILFIIKTLCEFVHFTNDDFEEKYNSLFNAMRIHVEQNLEKSTPSTNTKTVHYHILVLIWSLSDQTVTVPSLLRVGFGKSIIEWLNYSTLPNNHRRPMVSIVHNLSRHDDGADELNKYEAIETINRMQELDSVRQTKMALINTMSLSLLSTPEQIKNNPTKTKPILDQLLQITINASTAEKYRYYGFHISELLAVFVKLFVDDTTFNYVMNEIETNPSSTSTSTINLFSDLLIRFRSISIEKNRLDQFTSIALFNILWSISFHDIYHETLKQNTELIKTIIDVAKDYSQIVIEQYVPRSMQSIKKAADGILFNLGFETIPLINKQTKPLVMISYCHANNEFCDKILELLDQRADLFDIWIDKRYCKSSTDVWEAIAKGIKNAQLIICIVSTEYLASKACRQEIIYAKDRLNKRFLPVYMEKPDVSDWLDIRLAEFKYVRFQNIHLKLDARKSEEFLSTVIETISPGHISPIRKEITISEINSRKSIMTWTQNDIHHWFIEHEISHEIENMYQFKTGRQMITYAQCLKDGWQKQYEHYALRYAQQHPGKELFEHEFALFVSELKQLTYDSRHDSSQQQYSTISDTSQKSSYTCALL